MPVTKLRLMRESSGLTQRQQTEKLGISVATYAPIERGSMKPSARVRDLLETEFGFPIAVLLAPVRFPAARGAKTVKAANVKAKALAARFA